MIYMTRGLCDKALDNSERIVANHPNASMQLHVLGMILTCLRRPNEAISQYKRVLRLDPYPTDIFIKNIGAAYFAAERYEELIDFTNKWIHLRHGPLWSLWSHINLAAAYSILGSEEDAKRAAAKVVKADQNISLWFLKKAFFFMPPDDINRFIMALRKAGLPE